MTRFIIRRLLVTIPVLFGLGAALAAVAAAWIAWTVMAAQAPRALPSR